MEIIIGRQGSGKTTELFKRIKQLPQGTQVFIVVPEQYTFIAERDLFKNLNCTASSEICVTNLTRLAYKIIGNASYDAIKVLTDEARNMIIRYIINRNRDNLDVFKAVSSKQGFADNVGVIFGEIKKNSITFEMLENAKENSSDELLKAKIADIDMLYNEYLSYIGDTFTDKDGFLDKCCELVSQSDIVKNSYFFFDNFYSFDKSDLSFITELFKYAKNCCASLTYSPNDFFEVSEYTLKEIKECATNANIPYSITDMGEKKSSTNAIRHLEKNINKFSANIYDGENPNIFTNIYKDTYDEVLHCATLINKLVREHSYRYSDINITISDSNEYATLIKEIFDEFDIPFFSDNRRKIAYTPHIRALLCLTHAQSDISSADIIAFAKTGFSDISYDDCCELENYVLKYGIKGEMFFDEFTLNDERYPFDLEKLNEIRKKLFGIFTSYTEKTGNVQTIGQYAKALFEYLSEIGFNESLNKTVEEFKASGDFENANIYAQIKNKLMSVLDSMYSFFTDEAYDATTVAQMLSYALSNCDVGVIPSVIDKVNVGDTLRSRSSDIKCLFVLGANEGKFPSTHISASVFTDKEKNKANELGLNLISTSEYRINKENFVIYTLLSKPTQRLYLSCVYDDTGENASVPSETFEKISEMFSQNTASVKMTDIMATKQSAFNRLSVNLSERHHRAYMHDTTNDAIYDKYNEYFDSEDELHTYSLMVKNGLNFSNDAVIHDKDAYQKLIELPLKASISKLEKYASCPFSFYAEYVLKLKQRDVHKIESYDTGNIMHEVVEKFSQMLLYGDIDITNVKQEDIKELSDALCDKIIAEYKSSIYQRFSNSKYLLNKLKKTSRNALWEIIKQMQRSDFAIKETETGFGKYGKHHPICIDTASGKVYLEGKVDRVDICEMQEEKFVKIIDYKTGNTDFDFTKLYYGLSLQLPIYISALTTENDTDKAAGIFYLHLSQPMVKVNNSDDLANVIQTVTEQFNLCGLMLNEVKVIKAMDNDYMNGSFIEPVKMKDGEINKNDKLIDEFEFDAILDYAMKKAQESAENIIEAKIPIKPYLSSGNTPCKYCKYKGFCKFSTDFSGNCYNNISSKTAEDILTKNSNN